MSRKKFIENMNAFVILFCSVFDSQGLYIFLTTWAARCCGLISSGLLFTMGYKDPGKAPLKGGEENLRV